MHKRSIKRLYTSRYNYYQNIFQVISFIEIPDIFINFRYLKFLKSNEWKFTRIEGSGILLKNIFLYQIQFLCLAILLF